MNQDAQLVEGNPNSHLYRLKPWVIIYYGFSLVFILLVAGFPMMFLFAMLRMSGQPNDSSEMVLQSVQCAFVPLFLMLGLILLQQMVNIIAAFFSYIRVTPEGIENKIWPYRHIRSRWAELDRLGQAFLQEVVYLKSFEVIGPSLSHAWPFKQMNFLQPSIALSMYNGWPNGELATDLKRYAPHLFESRPAQAEHPGHAQSSNGSGSNQEQRLLAALSHASVLFSGIGAAVPLLVYITQKQKSAYLAFQSLQAFFYQLIGFLVSAIFPICIVGVFFLPVVGSTMIGEDIVSMPFLSGIMGFSLVSGLLLGLGALAYGIYGIIGAILVYQGKDFRYVILGNLVAKRNPPGAVTVIR